MRTSVMPERAQRSSQISSRGRPRIGTRHLGTEFVRGRRRVPWPPASKKAFTVWPRARNILRISDRCRLRKRQESPSRACVFVTVDERIVHDNLGALAVEGDDQNIGLHLLYDIGQLRLVLHLAHNLNVGLVGNRRHHQFPHQARMICHQYADSFHGATPAQSIGGVPCEYKVQKRSMQNSSGREWAVLRGANKSSTNAGSTGTKAGTNSE